MDHKAKIKFIKDFVSKIENNKKVEYSFEYNQLVDIIGIDYLERFDKNYNKFLLDKETIVSLLKQKKHKEILDKIILNNKYANYFCKLLYEGHTQNALLSRITFSSFRYWWNDQYCWCYLPNIKQIDKIKNLLGKRKILEVGAGNGLLAGILRSAGMYVIATDPLYEYNRNNYIFIEKLTCFEAIRKYKNCECLLMAWGRGYFDKNCFDNFKGDMIILIGEDEGGCTSDGYLNDIENFPNWKLIKTINHHHFSGYCDSIKIYQKTN